MFSGPAGTGKTTLGRIFAMAMLCDSPVDGNPCCVCESCKLFLSEQHFGYQELDAASVGGKEDMVKLRDDAAFSAVSKKKIILLDECHDISSQGQDALLKQTEQCPEHLVYIFCTTEPEKMKNTLRERCMKFQTTAIDSALVVSRLKKICEQENISYDDTALALIADKSGGHARDAVNTLEQVMYLGQVNMENMNTAIKNSEEDIFTIVANLGKDLGLALAAYQKVSSCLSPFDLYSQIINLVNDSCKFLYGYTGFIPQRLQLIAQLSEIHGQSLLEFLNYLVTRDKFVDRIGLQSDIIVLHYKFSAHSFNPQPVQQSISQPPSQIISQSPTPQKSVQPSVEQPQVLSFSQLQKMSHRDRYQALRDQHALVSKKVTTEEKETIATTWPLSKIERPGESSLDEGVLSPLEFSKKLVGGRSGEL